MPFPNINPTAFTFMKIDVQWYGIAYAVGLLLGLMNAKIITKKKTLKVHKRKILKIKIMNGED